MHTSDKLTYPDACVWLTRLFCEVVETRQVYRAIRKSRWYNPTGISRTNDRARKGIREALRARGGILSVTDSRWLLGMCTETDAKYVMHTNFQLPDGHNPVIGELITKKIVSMTYALAHQNATSTSTMGFAWLERIQQQHQEKLLAKHEEDAKRHVAQKIKAREKKKQERKRLKKAGEAYKHVKVPCLCDITEARKAPFCCDRRKKSHAKTAQKEEPVCLVGRMTRCADKSFASVSEHMGGGPYMLPPHELLQYN